MALAFAVEWGRPEGGTLHGDRGRDYCCYLWWFPSPDYRSNWSNGGHPNGNYCQDSHNWQHYPSMDKAIAVGVELVNSQIHELLLDGD